MYGKFEASQCKWVLWSHAKLSVFNLNVSGSIPKMAVFHFDLGPVTNLTSTSSQLFLNKFSRMLMIRESLIRD
jgi:hypothetical protein